jgi:hypothetical protein
MTGRLLNIENRLKELVEAVRALAPGDSSKPAKKPFKGVISRWQKVGNRVAGMCEQHVDAPCIRTGIAVGYEIITSAIVKIEDRGSFAICETRNSIYVLVSPFSAKAKI